MNIQKISAQVNDTDTTVIVQDNRQSTMYSVDTTNKTEALRLFELNSHKVKWVGTVIYNW